MGSRLADSPDNLALIDQLVAALQAAMDPAPVIGHPIGTVPAVPSAVLYPGSPTVEALDAPWSEDLLRLQVIVYLSRANSPDSIRIGYESIADIRTACSQVPGARFVDMTIGESDVGGVNYLTANHTIEIGAE